MAIVPGLLLSVIGALILCLALAIGWEVVAVLAIPIMAFVINWSLRATRGYSLSAAADFALALAAFDFSAIVAHKSFEKVITDITFRDSVIPMFATLFILTLIAWLIYFLPEEHRLLSRYDPIERKYKSNAPTGQMIIAWSFLCVFLVFHIFPFLTAG